MKPSLQLRLGQHLAMTPQLQQAIRLLQLSSLELELELRQAMESNPLLDLDEETDEVVEGVSSSDPIEPQDDAAAEDASALDAEAIPDDLAVDLRWEDVYEGGTGPGDEEYPSEARASSPQTLREQLAEQMRLARSSPVEEVIAVAIIDAVDESGYLAVPLEEIRQSLGQDVDPDDMEVVLRRVQSCSPSGVAARNLQECLLIQLHQLDPETPWREEARAIVSQHLDLLAGHEYEQLARRTHLRAEELQTVLALIRSLNPRPGNLVDGAPTQYVVPDVLVRKVHGQWHVELNADALPRLRINPYYVALMRRAGRGDDYRYIKSQLQEARWLMKSLNSRNLTLLRVARCITERQQAFLEEGPEGMQPMVLHDVAEDLGMHESTVSRVTMQKYMHTPRGTFELKYFFSSHVNTAEGGTCSATALRAFIKKLIIAEHPTEPLSDNRIAALLGEQGIQVARRTVAKYREMMAIPAARERRHLV
jgi:RNA polymerase sigma-54 factor